jgi:hypothetical protein
MSHPELGIWKNDAEAINVAAVSAVYLSNLDFPLVYFPMRLMSLKHAPFFQSCYCCHFHWKSKLVWVFHY